MGRKIAVAALVVALAGVAAWIGGAFDPDPVTLPPGPRAPERPPVAAPEPGPAPEKAGPAIGAVRFDGTQAREENAPTDIPQGASGGFQLTGLVLAAERPLAGATVDLLEDNAGVSGMVQLGDVKGTVTTGADGSFAFEDLFPGEKYCLRAAHPEWCVGRATGIDAAVRGSLKQVIRLEGGVTLTGQVRTKEGRPLDGAEVGVFDAMVQAFDPENQIERRGKSRADGTYEVKGLARGIKRVLVVCEGFASESMPTLRIDGDKGGVDFALAPGRTITGTVVEEGTNARVKGARVAVRQLTDPDPSRRVLAQVVAVRSGDSGEFALPGLVEGSYELWSTAPGFLDGARTTLASGSTGVAVVLRPAARIEGRVLDAATGAPVTPSTVILTGSPDFVFAAKGRLCRVRDAEARFLVTGLQAGKHYLVARAEGYAETVHGPLEVGDGQVLRGVALRVGRGATLRGQVVDPAGKGVEKVRVSAMRQVRPAGNAPDFLLPMLQSQAQSIASLTGADGRYEIAGLREGNWQVVVNHPRFATDRTFPVSLAADQVRDMETITVSEGGTLQGMVRTADGRPDGRARLVVQHHLVKEIKRETATLSDGTFLLEGLPAGDYRITVQQREGTPSLGDILLAGAPGQPPKLHTVRPGESTSVDL